MRLFPYLLPIVFAAMCVLNSTLAEVAVPATTQPIDVLDYFLQKDDIDQSWTLNGYDVRPDADPDGTDTLTYIGNKWSEPGCYEVFKVTPTELQIRYEVVRHDRINGDGNWIRRYEEIGDDHGKYPGHVWMPRHPAVDGTVYQTHHRKDRWVFDKASKSYVIDKSGCSNDEVIAYSFAWSNTDWGDRNQTGMELNPTLRLVSQWQREGKIFETYDYSRGKGLTRWRWLERVSTLPRVEGEMTGNVFRCEEGAVLVESPGDSSHPPVVSKYDLAKGSKGEGLEVVSFKSYWAQELGEQWYVVYRDTLAEGALVRKDERIAHDFTLPEWKGKTGASIADLHGLYTKSPR
jgi:hypothetical protein